MLRPTAVTVKPIKDYHVIVEFDNGERKDFDVRPYIKGNWYGKLSDNGYFNTVKTDGYTITWPEGQDICPDELYDFGVSV